MPVNLKSLLRPYLLPVYNQLQILKLKVNGQKPGYCPCCGHTIGQWKDFHFAQYTDRLNPALYQTLKQDICCPFCGSFPRHRLQVVWMEQHLGELRNKRILYFAVESGVKMWMDRQNLSYQSADLYEKADLQINIEATGLPGESCDFIFCHHVLEHVSDYHRALDEMHRILKPNGCFICSMPILDKYKDTFEDAECKTPEYRIQHFGQADHLRIFGANVRDIIGLHHFQVNEVNSTNMPLECLPVDGPADYDKTLLFVCRKL